MNEYYQKMDAFGFMRLTFNDLRGNARKRNIEVNITVEDLYNLYRSQEGKCALTGIEMTFRRQELGRTRRDRYLYNISADRIDASQHYHKNNIQLVCSIVNTIKWDLPQQDFIDICRKVTENSK